MNPITSQAVDAAVAHALDIIKAAADLAALKAGRGAAIGDGSPIAALNAQMGKIAPEFKAEAGKLVGQARASLSAAYAAREAQLHVAEEAAKLAAETVDVTAAPQLRPLGARHPLSLLQDTIADIFVGMGWEIAEGPEVENEWFNFDALNFDADHPARAMQDTFFVDPATSHLVLRTHTSPVQVRSMLERDLPLYVLCPGRVFRTDELDATHTPVFHQVEGLAVDKGLNMADLRGTLEHFAREMFGPEAQIRLRPSFFRSPNHRLSSTFGTQAPRVALAGLSGAVVAWSTRTCSRLQASTLRFIPALHLAWASSARSCSATT